MLKNVTPLVRKSQTGLVAYTRAIQYLLEQSPDIEKSFGLVEFGLDHKDKTIPIEPVDSRENYKSLQPDGSVDSFSFLYIKGPVVVDDYNDPHGLRYMRATLSIVVYGTGYKNFNRDKYYVEEAEKIQRKISEFDSYTIQKVYLSGKDAYIDFSGVDTKDRHFYSPHYCFRLEGELIYPEPSVECVDLIPYLVRQANQT